MLLCQKPRNFYNLNSQAVFNHLFPVHKTCTLNFVDSVTNACRKSVLFFFVLLSTKKIDFFIFRCKSAKMCKSGQYKTYYFADSIYRKRTWYTWQKKNNLVLSNKNFPRELVI